jgi:hypothetical protein
MAVPAAFSRRRETFNTKEGLIMGKEKDTKKETKKAPAKSLKEKRAEKQLKKGK